MSDNRTRQNRFNIEWLYARQCWDALSKGLPLPPVPKFQTYMVYARDGSTKLISEEKITPMKIVFKGHTYFD